MSNIPAYLENDNPETALEVLRKWGKPGEHPLRTLRIARGWTQLDLATRAGLTLNTVAAIEKRSATAARPTTKRKLLVALGYSAEMMGEVFGG